MNENNPWDSEENANKHLGTERIGIEKTFPLISKYHSNRAYFSSLCVNFQTIYTKTFLDHRNSNFATYCSLEMIQTVVNYLYRKL